MANLEGSCEFVQLELNSNWLIQFNIFFIYPRKRLEISLKFWGPIDSF